MAKQGDWVLIKSTILQPDQRAPQVPGDTAGVPLVQWVKGRLTADADIWQPAQVIIRTGRLVSGALVEEAPAYRHSFGSFIPELLKVQESIRRAMWGGEDRP